MRGVRSPISRRVGDEALEHGDAELAHPGRVHHERAPLLAGHAPLEPLFVDFVREESIPHEERDFEGPVFALVSLALRELLRDVLAEGEDAVVHVARFVLDHHLQERAEGGRLFW